MASLYYGSSGAVYEYICMQILITDITRTWLLFSVKAWVICKSTLLIKFLITDITLELLLFILHIQVHCKIS